MRTMKDDLIRCISLIVLGVGTWAPFIPEKVKNIIGPILLVLLIVLALAGLGLSQRRRNMSPEEKRDLDRERKDERALMIDGRMAIFCVDAETILLVIVLCVLVFRNYPYTYVLYWIFVGRCWLILATRWWLERKY